MKLTDVHLLSLINFIHYWNFGLTILVISSHFAQIGGTQGTLGIGYAVVFCSCQVSRNFLALFRQTSKYTIAISLLGSFMCHLISASTDSYVVFLLARWTNALMNSVERCSIEIVIETELEEEHTKALFLIDSMKTAGLVAGHILGGYIYSVYQDYELIALVASASDLVAFMLLLQMRDLDLSPVVESHFVELPLEFYQRLKDLLKIDYVAHWDIFFLQIIYITSFIIYFSTFQMLLTLNYDVSIIVMGYTIAYQTVLLFVSRHLVEYLKKKFDTFSVLSVFAHCLLISSVTLSALYYAPTYKCYLVLVIPVMVTHAIVTTGLMHDLKVVDDGDKLIKATETIKDIMHFVAPIVYGKFGRTVFKILAILPPAAAVVYLARHQIRRRQSSLSVQMQMQEVK